MKGIQVKKLDLFYKDLKIGTLSFNGQVFMFDYSPEFIKNKKLDPIVEFPNKTQHYSSKTLFNFFNSRVPSKIRNKVTKESDLIPLLQEYGKQVVHDPFVLTTTP